MPATNKKLIKKTVMPLPRVAIFLLAIVLTAGIGIGFIAGIYAHDHEGLSTQQSQASPREIESAKNAIARLFSDKAVADCGGIALVDGTLTTTNKYELDYRTIRINRHANRAIVSDCASEDTLLYKNKQGEWTKTNVNVQINNRLNPAWQRACDIADITVADDTVRAENNSIDEFNLAECQRIQSL